MIPIIQVCNIFDVFDHSFSYFSVQDHDVKLLIPLVFLVTISFLYILIIKKKMLSQVVDFTKLEIVLCNLFILVPVHVQDNTDITK